MWYQEPKEYQSYALLYNLGFALPELGNLAIWSLCIRELILRPNFYPTHEGVKGVGEGDCGLGSRCRDVVPEALMDLLASQGGTLHPAVEAMIGTEHMGVSGRAMT